MEPRCTGAWRSLLTVTACCLLCAAVPARADEDNGWSRQILRSLERREQRVRRDADDAAETREGGRQRPGLAPSGTAGERAAAARAVKKHGGRALAVRRSRDGYRVRLLLDNGHVTTVAVED